MRKQSVKRGAWYIGGRKKTKERNFFSFAVLGAPILGNLATAILRLRRYG